MSVIEMRSQAEQWVQYRRYAEATALYEQLIEAEPETLSHYGWLGIVLLLQDQEAEAQMAWMTPMMEADPAQVEAWTAELAQLLATESDRQAATDDHPKAWLLRQHLRELQPENLENLCAIVSLGLKANLFDPEDGTLEQIHQLLHPGAIAHVDAWIEFTTALMAQLPNDRVFQVLSSCISLFPEPEKLLQAWLVRADLLNQVGQTFAAAEIGKLCLQMNPQSVEIRLPIANWLLQTGENAYMKDCISLAEDCLERSPEFVSQLLATHILLSASLSICADWSQSVRYYQIHKQLLAEFPKWLAEKPGQVNRAELPKVLAMGSFMLYFEDNPTINRPIRNQFASLCEAEFQHQVLSIGKQFSHAVSSCQASQKRLKIGYLSDSLRQHSVGWLSRWLLQYHNLDCFDVYLYSLSPSNDRIQNSLRQHYGDRFQSLSPKAIEVAEQIYQDGIDILVELDSLTCLSGCATLAIKPAPIQVNWLGYDATGLPAVDYFLADPYVLPNDADTYYQEKIWRLPQTYLAVDGFEVDVPSLRRDQLDIPNDAIVYLSSQSGLKRNPDNIRVQLSVLNAVPNSYFLIKSWRAEQNQLIEFFGQLADEMGVSRDRLRYLPRVSSELTHRANLQLADVVLDTYPYNGATTTMEALWVGLPIVTRVGEQFAARNSYTMLMNAGISEGIAWNDDEYIEWGIRFGQDEILRRNVSLQLKRSRQTSPLWNGKQFAQQVETAYQQMWQRYCETE